MAPAAKAPGASCAFAVTRMRGAGAAAAAHAGHRSRTCRQVGIEEHQVGRSDSTASMAFAPVPPHYNVHVRRALAQPDQSYASRRLIIDDEEFISGMETSGSAIRAARCISHLLARAASRALLAFIGNRLRRPGFFVADEQRLSEGWRQSFEPPTTNCPMCSRTLWRKRSLLVTVVPPLSTNSSRRAECGSPAGHGSRHHAGAVDLQHRCERIDSSAE